ncbi:MAG: hypothetical protein WCF18_01125, partial [Chthoniobacteraceae bacterium]
MKFKFIHPQILGLINVKSRWFEAYAVVCLLSLGFLATCAAQENSVSGKDAVQTSARISSDSGQPGKPPKPVFDPRDYGAKGDGLTY